MDPKPANIKNFIGATAICPNIKEARKILGENLSAEECAVELSSRFNHKYVFIKSGSEGITLYDGKIHKVSTKVRTLEDVTGAGDTVAATLILSLLVGLNAEESATLANYAAGIAVEKFGTAAVQQRELKQRILEDID